MKNLLFVLALICTSLCTFSQTTYYWVGGTGSTATVSFTSNSKWNTALDGSGTARSISAATDILIVDGTNVGGSTPTVGNISATCGSTTLAQLILRNGANLTLVKTTASTGSIAIGGDATNAEDLLINAGCTLNSTVQNSIIDSAGSTIALSATATGRIFGNLYLINGASKLSSVNPQTGGAIFFENGSECRVKVNNTFSSSGTSSSQYPFGSSSGVPGAIVFNSGSKLTFLGGNNVYTNTSSFNPIDLKPGSTFRIETSIPSATVTSSNLFSSRKYSNVEIGGGVIVIGDAFYNIDNLTIDAGSSFYMKASGSSPISGNIVNNGVFGSATGFTSSTLLMKGLTPQTVSGTGTFETIGAFTISPGSNVTLNANLILNGSSTSSNNGTLNLQNKTISGTGSYRTVYSTPVTSNVTSAAVGSYTIVLDATVYNSTTNNAGVANGLQITGNGIPANTFIIGTSSSASTITISNAITATPTNVTISGGIPVLRTSNTNGIDGGLSGLVTLSLSSLTDYYFDAPTTQPFSNVVVSTMRNVTFNAACTSNRSSTIDSVLTINSGLFSIRATDTIRIKNGKDIGGAPFTNAKHIVALSNGTNTGTLRIDLVNGSKLFPIGSTAYYLPLTLSSTTNSTLLASVFEGITDNGLVSGTPLVPAELSKVVNAVWKVGRSTGSGDIGLDFAWDQLLEGGLFTTQANSRIGIIKNTGTAWDIPFGTGNNTTNTAFGPTTSTGNYSIGSVPLISAFTFNEFANRTYGNPDFSSGATSLNTAQPIVYTSSNPAVATVSSAGVIHIVGVGTTDINASQESDGVYLAATQTQTLTINKASLVITANDVSKFEGTANPVLTASYTGFVYAENESVLTTPVDLTTTALTASTPGSYPIIVSGATASNYDLSFVAGTLTVLAKQNQTISYVNVPPITYGTPTYNLQVSSTNSSIPLVSTSSNPSVVTINGTTVQIVGVGTATIVVSQPGNDAYFPATDVLITIVVNKAPLLISVRDTFKIEGTTNPTFTLDYNGFVLGETTSVLSAQPMITTTATLNSAPGVYSVVAGSANADNYEITYRSGLLTINPDDSTVQTMVAYYNNGQVYLKLFSPQTDIGKVMVYDVQGRFLAQKDILVNKGFSATNLIVNNVASGNYLVVFRGKNGAVTRWLRIIK
jgi:hypothetical protein